jgi:hypothetical protein
LFFDFVQQYQRTARKRFPVFIGKSQARNDTATPASAGIRPQEISNFNGSQLTKIASNEDIFLKIEPPTLCVADVAFLRESEPRDKPAR